MLSAESAGNDGEQKLLAETGACRTLWRVEAPDGLELNAKRGYCNGESAAPAQVSLNSLEQ